jgi:undecaprenyl-diphosphatase
VFGILLGMADRRVAKPGSEQVTLSLALLIGLAQAIAPIPGVSRSGVTITAALLLGMSRHAAARFSFLLSIPVIAGAGVLKGWELASSGAGVDWLLLAMGAVVSGVTAYLCIALFLRLLDRIGLMPFVYYRVVLAVLLYGLWLA